MKKVFKGCLISIGAVVGIVILLGVLVVASAGNKPSTPAKTDERFDRGNWAELVSNPDNHKGASVEIVGKVFTDPEKNDDRVGLQLWADPQNNEWNTLVSYANPSVVVKRGDFVKVVGTVRGSFTGENAFGADLSAPIIDAETLTVVDALAAAPPTKHSVNLNATQEQHGLRVTVTKVEFAEEETRLFVTIQNATEQGATFFTYNAKGVQGSSQLDAEYATDYPEVQSELLAGIESSGVVVFPAMKLDQASKFVLEARTDDYSLNFVPYVFEVQP